MSVSLSAVKYTSAKGLIDFNLTIKVKTNYANTSATLTVHNKIKFSFLPFFFSENIAHLPINLPESAEIN